MTTISKTGAVLIFGCVLLLSLSGCAGYNAARQCQTEAGPRPNAEADILGPLGAMANNAQPETQAYNKKIDDCMAKWRAQQPTQAQ